MKTHLLTLLIVTFLFSCSGPDTEAPSASIDDKISEVENNLTTPIHIKGDSTWTIEERMEHYGVPGVSIAVINDYKISWVKTYGVMDKESQAPVMDNTLFQAGSISKPVAAYGALKLVELDKMNLDADVNTHLKSWKLPDSEFTTEKKVALKHLLNHSGGLTVHGFLGYSPDLPVPSLIEVLDGTEPANSSSIYVDKIPEESFRYSGGGYTVMQQMMIDVEDKTFPELMDNLVLSPLAMENSTYNQPLSDDQLKSAATGYLPNGTMTKGKRHTYPEMAAAGLWTTAEDLAKFAVNIQQSIQKENNKVLSQDMTTKMLTPFVEEFTGLGLFITNKKDDIYFGHGGWDEGFSSELMAHKDKGYGVVILTNSNHPDFISELIRSVALTYNWDDYVLSYEKMDTEQTGLDELAGRYKIHGNKLIEVYQENNNLLIKELGEEPAELVKVSDSTYVDREDYMVLQFKLNTESGDYEMCIIDTDSGEIKSSYARMDPNEKLPLELLISDDFEQGLSAYQSIKSHNPKDRTISEGNLNNIGYHFLGSGNLDLAKSIFKVNTQLYPNSSNVYDSYAEACMMNDDIDLAIENYSKSVELDPSNHNAEKLIKELEEKKSK